MNRNRIASLVALACAAMTASAAVHAEAAPLSVAELARCAGDALHLRDESARLNQLNAKLDQRREALNRRSAALEAESAQLDRSNLDAGLELNARQKQHNAEAESFNGEIARIRQDISAINGVKDNYDRNCSQRPYRRNDLATLPPAAQAAMRAGLADVAVPYLDTRVIRPLP